MEGRAAAAAIALDTAGLETRRAVLVQNAGTEPQRITEWTLPTRLAFHMEHTDLAFARCVSRLSDEFELRSIGPGRETLLIRTTRVEIRGKFRCVKEAAVYVGLKAVHRHVFRAWRVSPAPRQSG